MVPNGHYNQIVEVARTLMNSDAASIQELDPADSRLKLLAHTGFHAESTEFWTYVDAGAGSTCGRALTAQKRVVVPDIDQFEGDPDDIAAFRKSSIMSVQLTPLVASSGRIVGMMSTHWNHPHTPSAESYRFFDVLARLAADFMERAHTEAALRESEGRQVFLLKLSDALRPLTDAKEIQQITCRLLGEHLGVDRAYYVDIDDAPGESFGWFLPQTRRREVVVVDDIHRCDLLPAADIAAMEAVQQAAIVAAPIVERDVLVAMLCVTQTVPRRWTPAEVTLVRDVMERTWVALERARAEAALRELNEQLEERVRQRTSEVRAMFERLVSVQEGERRRIARDIHDQIGQQMTALRVTASVERAERTQRLAEELDQSIDSITWQLGPAALDHLALPAALQSLVAGWSERFAVAADFAGDGVQDLRLSRDVEANLYRIAQEALHNVAKHAHATQVTVCLLQQKDNLVLLIEDNGRGFDPDGDRHADGASGMGLTNIRARAALVGGRLDIESIAGHGTSIYVRIPGATT